MKKLRIILTIIILFLSIFRVNEADAFNTKYITLNDLANSSTDLEYKTIEIDFEERLGNSYIFDANDYGITIFNRITGDENDLLDDIVEYIIVPYDGEELIFKDELVWFQGNIAKTSIEKWDEAKDESKTLYGYINKNYEWVLPPIFDEAIIFDKLLIAGFSDDNTQYVFNENGELIDTLKDIVYVSDCGEYLMVMHIDNKCVWYDRELNIVDEFKYENWMKVLLGDVKNNMYYRVDETNEGTILSRYTITGEEVNRINLDKEVVRNSSYYYSYLLNNGDLLLEVMVEGRGRRLALFSAEAGKISAVNSEVTEEWHSRIFELGDYLIFDGGIVLDRELNYIGRLYKDKILNILGTEGRLVCMTLEIVGENYEMVAFDKEIHILYDKSAGFSGELAYHEEKEVNDLIEQKLNVDEISAYLNNKKIEFDISPITENDRTLVPMRAIFEALGADVEWDNETNTATAELEGTSISITIDSDIMYKNGEVIPLDAPARLIDDGYTFIPLRAVSEAFGCMVKWTEELQRVDILKSE